MAEAENSRHQVETPIRKTNRRHIGTGFNQRRRIFQDDLIDVGSDHRPVMVTPQRRSKTKNRADAK